MRGRKVYQFLTSSHFPHQGQVSEYCEVQNSIIKRELKAKQGGKTE